MASGPLAVRVVAVHGPDESGKDTIVRLTQELLTKHLLTSRRQGFADMMKIGIGHIFGIPETEAVAWCDLLKQPHTTVEARGGAEPVIEELSGRDFIRNYAQSAKLLHGEDIWAAMLLPGTGPADFVKRWKIEDDTLPDFALISDLRFTVEANHVDRYFGEIWGITGRGDTDSPTDLDPARVDFWIDNAGTEDNTRWQIDKHLESHWMDYD